MANSKNRNKRQKARPRRERRPEDRHARATFEELIGQEQAARLAELRKELAR